MEEKPNYYAVIPANVRYDENLKPMEKLLYGEITALTYKTGECWASNNYFARLYKTTPQAISKWILNLKKFKYVDIDYERVGKEIQKRIIRVSIPVDTYQQEDDRGINTCLGGYQHTIKENNTSNNNTSINNKKKYIKEKYGNYGRVTLTKDEYFRLVEEYGEEFINNNKNKYSNFNLVLRKSIRENWFSKPSKGSNFLDVMKKERDKYD